METNINMREAERNNVQIEEEKLSEICEFICDNYLVLTNEFTRINKLLELTEEYARAYPNTKGMISIHVKNEGNKCCVVVLREIVSSLEQVRKGAGLEFTEKIDLVNIYDEILRKIKEGNIFSYLHDINKIVPSIIHQIDRIKYAKDIKAKVTILKGMILYY